LIFGPFVVLANEVPFFGNMLSNGLSLFALVVGSAFSLIAIALGHIDHISRFELATGRPDRVPAGSPRRAIFVGAG
jgi:hypothetical protein